MGVVERPDHQYGDDLVILDETQRCAMIFIPLATFSYFLFLFLTIANWTLNFEVYVLDFDHFTIFDNYKPYGLDFFKSSCPWVNINWGFCDSYFQRESCRHCCAARTTKVDGQPLQLRHLSKYHNGVLASLPLELVGNGHAAHITHQGKVNCEYFPHS